MKRLVKGVLGIVLAAGAATSNMACTPPWITNEKEAIAEIRREKGYLAAIEGLGAGGQMRELAEIISAGPEVAGRATAGNPEAHMPLIREAYEQGKEVYIAGFSLGENEARKLAKLCSKEGIKIKILFLLDGPCRGELAKTVETAVDGIGTGDIYPFRRIDRYSKADCENPETKIEYFSVDAGHLGVPAASIGIIYSRIKESLR